jgi:hypothetical protein
MVIAGGRWVRRGMTASDITIHMQGPYSAATVNAPRCEEASNPGRTRREKEEHGRPAECHAEVHEHAEGDRFSTAVERRWTDKYGRDALKEARHR